MAPALVLARTLRSILPTTVDSHISAAGGSVDGPAGEAGRLYGRGDRVASNPSHGVLDPHDINNVGFFVLFALIGVAFVVTGIWFFFWAKNGGFHFKETDWEEYKSTVLRRRGPNGTLLSGATASTKLGGGSVYKDVRDEDDGTTVITDSTGLSGVTAGASDIAARERRRAKQEQRDRERRRRRGERKKEAATDRHADGEGVTDELAEKEALEELRSYRHEKAARVGGLNREADGSQWEGSTNPSESTTSSELLSYRQQQPAAPSSIVTTTTTTTTTAKTRKTGTGAGAIRKVYSTADRNERREAERIRAEARRLREESRRNVRRNFSFNRPEASESAATESLLEGSDLGTRSRLDTVPESRGEGVRDREREREERRARRAGYRRGRGHEEEL